MFIPPDVERGAQAPSPASWRALSVYKKKKKLGWNVVVHKDGSVESLSPELVGQT